VAVAALPTQPLVPVPVTETVAVAEVVNVIGPAPVAEVSVPEVVVQANEAAPEAMKLTDPPLTTEADGGVNATTGSELSVKSYSPELTETPLSVTTHRNLAVFCPAPIAWVGV
jgi:hypothetical protein